MKKNVYDLLLNFLSEDECKKVENYYKESKFFQDYILVSKIEHESLSNLIKEFFLSYFARVEYLEKMDERRYLQLNKWIIKKGKNKIKELLNYTKEDINKEGVVNILATYDGLIEQGMDEDADCLLDILIDAPSSIYKEMLYLESEIICTNKGNGCIYYHENYDSDESDNFKDNNINICVLGACSNAGLFI